MKVNKFVDSTEKICVWSMTGLLCFVGLGNLPINPTSFFDFADSFYYFSVATVVCPKTPLSFNKKLIFVFIAFFYGVWTGLI